MMGKTTKIVEKMLKEGWTIGIIPVQHMFPNCQVKYKTNCKDMKSCDKDKEFWDKLNEKIKDWKPVKQPFRTTNVKLEHKKPPKGFEDDTERAKNVKFE